MGGGRPEVLSDMQCVRARHGLLLHHAIYKKLLCIMMILAMTIRSPRTYKTKH